VLGEGGGGGGPLGARFGGRAVKGGGGCGMTVDGSLSWVPGLLGGEVVASGYFHRKAVLTARL
jgi:hypothetical protein